MNPWFAAAVYMVLLHRVDGGVVAVNPAQVTSLMPPWASKENKLLPGRCVVGLTDGKFVAVLETCDTVRQLLEVTPPLR